MLVEMGSQLGGTTTVGGVVWPALFNAWGKQVIAGIGWELVTRAVELDGGKLPDISQPNKVHGGHAVGVNGPLYAALAEEACIGAGVAIGYYEMPLAVQSLAEGWEVETIGKGLRRTVRCRQLIDCTGGADVVGMIGLPRLREAEAAAGYADLLLRRLRRLETQRRGDREAISRSATEWRAARRGLLPFGTSLPQLPQGWRRDAKHVFGADSSTSATKTQANIAGRASVLRLLRFIRSLPGCGGGRIVRMQQETAVRETYRIVGETQITRHDFESGRVYDDAVGYSFYPIDLHDRKGVEPQLLKRGVVPTIPLRALVPKGSRNLLVAGRSISSDRAANSALRVQASCMAMGQAAGATAVLACRKGVSPLQVPIGEVRSLLSRHGAILPTV